MVVNDGMDILGGSAISRGPRNTLANGYVGTPIAITVEGANILTRTLMIFGQGAIRCHPYTLNEISSLASGDLKMFDKALWGHLGHVVRNGTRALVLSLTRGRLAGSPVGGPTATYFRRLSWASASFAFLADLAMGTLAGDLKRKEMLTGRFADIFSWMYLATTVLRRYEAEGRPKEDLPFVRYSVDRALHEMQVAFDGLYANMPVPGLTWLFRGPVAAWSRFNRLAAPPSDQTASKIALALQTPGEQRERLTRGMYVPQDPQRAVGRLEAAFEICFQAWGVVRKLKKAIRARELPKAKPLSLVEKALEKGILAPDEAELLEMAEAARQDAIQVDSFTLEEYLRSAVLPGGGADGPPATPPTEEQPVTIA